MDLFVSDDELQEAVLAGNTDLPVSMDELNRAHQNQQVGRYLENLRAGKGGTGNEEYQITRTPFIGGLWEVLEGLEAQGAGERFAAGKSGPKDWVALAKQKHAQEIEASKSMANAGWAGAGQQIVDSVTRLPAFAMEMAATGPVGEAAGQAAAKGAARMLGAGALKNTAVKALVRYGIGGGARAGAQALAMQGQFQSTVGQHVRPDVHWERSELGAMRIKIDKQGLPYYQALVPAFADTAIEVATEHLGEGLNKAAQYAWDAIPAEALGNAKGTLYAWWKAANPKGGVSDFISTVAAKGGYHGLFSEFLEERIGGVAKSAVQLQPWSKALPTGEELLVELGTLGIPSGAHGAIQSVIGGKEYLQGRQQKRERIEKAREKQKERYQFQQEEVAQLLTPEFVADFVNKNPDGAKILASVQVPSRAAFLEAGIEGWIQEEDHRKQFAEMVRQEVTRQEVSAKRRSRWRTDESSPASPADSPAGQATIDTPQAGDSTTDFPPPDIADQPTQDASFTGDLDLNPPAELGTPADYDSPEDWQKVSGAWREPIRKRGLELQEQLDTLDPNDSKNLPQRMALASAIEKLGKFTSAAAPSLEWNRAKKGPVADTTGVIKPPPSSPTAIGEDGSAAAGASTAKPIASLPGRETSIEVAGEDKPLPARYALMELDDLQASGSYRKGMSAQNPNYPAGLQPRSYARGNDDDLKVKRFAQEKKAGYYLADQPDATSGPPVVTPDAIALNGNGRIMSLQISDADGHLQEWYGKALAEKLEQFGIDPAALAPKSFKTAKGSTYEVKGDKTKRNKAARPEHAGEEGLQATSERTFYVSVDDATKLGEVQSEGGSKVRLDVTNDGRLGMKYDDGPSAGKFEKRTVVPFSKAPAVGLIPVEIWQGGVKHHFGNPIVSMEGGMKKPVLVRVVDMKADSPEAVKFARAGNVSQTQASSSMREAAAMAGILDEGLFSEIPIVEDQTISEVINESAAGRRWFKELMKAIPPSMHGRYATKDGAATPAGKELVQGILLAQVMSPNLTERLAATHPAWLKDIEGAVPQLLALRREQATNLLPQLVEAFEFLLAHPDIKTEGQLLDAIGQGKLFATEEPLSPGAQMLAAWRLDLGQGRAGVKTRESLAAIKGALTAGAGFFADELPPMEELVADALGVKPVAGAEFGENQSPSKSAESSSPIEAYGNIEERRKPKQPKPGVKTATSGPTEGIPRQHDIIRKMEHDFQVPIRNGRIHLPGVMAYFHKLWNLIRMHGKFAGDLALASHEIAHKIDNLHDLRNEWDFPVESELRRLDYDPGKARAFEGWAEFMRLYLTGDLALVKQMSPKTLAWLQGDFAGKHAETFQKIQELCGLITTWREADPSARVRGSRRSDGSHPSPAGMSMVDWLAYTMWNSGNDGKPVGWMHWIYQKLMDEKHFFHLFNEEAKRQGKQYKRGGSPEELARALLGTERALAETALSEGVFSFLTDPQTGTRKKLAEGIAETLSAIDKNERPELSSWLHARRAVELWKKGINPGISEEDAQAVYDAGKHNQAWEKFGKAVTKFLNAQKIMLAEIGGISMDQVEVMIDAHENYIPLNRVRDESVRSGRFGGRPLVNLGPVAHHMKGSGLEVVDPLHSMLEQTARMYAIATKQIVTNAMAESLVENASQPLKGMGAWMEAVPPAQLKTTFSLESIWPKLSRVLEAAGIDSAPIEVALKKMQPGQQQQFMHTLISIYQPDMNYHGDKPIVKIMLQGQPQFFYVQPDLYRTMMGMDQIQIHPFLDFLLGKAGDLVRTGATGLNLGFAVVNPFKDFLAFLAQASSSGVIHSLKATPLPDFIFGSTYLGQSIQHKFGKKDPRHTLMKETGVELRQGLGFDEASKEDVILGMMKSSFESNFRWEVKQWQENPAGRLWSWVSSPWRGMTWTAEQIQDFTAATEIGPRMAEFESTGEELGWDYARIKETLDRGERPPVEILAAMTNAANDVTVDFRRAGSWTRYLNRAFPFLNAHMQGGEKFLRTFRENPQRAAVAVAAIASFTFLMWRGVHDDDWYEDAPAWMKYGYWTITDGNGTPLYRVPRPHEWGWYVSAATEAMLNAWKQGKPDELYAWLGETRARELPSSLLDFAPAIAKPGIEAFSNWDDFRRRPINSPYDDRSAKNQYSTHTTELAKWIGARTGYSPNSIEHLLDGHTGGLYKSITKPAEKVLYRAEWTSADIPVISRFAWDKNYSQAVGDFSRLFERIKQLHADAKFAEKEGSPLPDELADRWYSAQQAKEFMGDVHKLIVDMPNRSERWRLEKYNVGLARRMLGLSELATRPDPIEAEPEGLPREIQALRDKYFVRSAKQRQRAAPAFKQGENAAHFQERLKAWRAAQRRGSATLPAIGGDS